MRDRLLDVVAEESDRLAQIVNDVLLASHLDSGQLQLNIETVDAARADRGRRRRRARRTCPRGSRSSFDAPKRLPPVARRRAAAAPGARQPRRERGQVLAGRRAGAGAARRSDERTIRWAVSDEGLGIPAAERRRIFEKFYRLDPNMTRGIGGTGLGLYICRELVRRLDGRIWVEANDGKGSTFVVELPGTSAPAKRRTAAAA